MVKTKTEVLTAIDNLRTELQEFRLMALKAMTDQTDPNLSAVPTISDLETKWENVWTDLKTWRSTFDEWKTHSTFTSITDAMQRKIKQKHQKLNVKGKVWYGHVDDMIQFLDCLDSTEIPNDKISDLGPTLQRIISRLADPGLDIIDQFLSRLDSQYAKILGAE
jgi:hypothetical protein